MLILLHTLKCSSFIKLRNGKNISDSLKNNKRLEVRKKQTNGRKTCNFLYYILKYSLSRCQSHKSKLKTVNWQKKRMRRNLCSYCMQCFIICWMPEASVSVGCKGRMSEIPDPTWFCYQGKLFAMCIFTENHIFWLRSKQIIYPLKEWLSGWFWHENKLL